MAPNRRQVCETNVRVAGLTTTHGTGATEAVRPLCNGGVNGGPRMGNLEPPTSSIQDLTSESELDFLRDKNLQFLKLLKKARVINHECITSKESKFPYTKLENLCAHIKAIVPTIHSQVTKDFIWENVLVWLYAMQRSFEGLRDLKYDNKFNLILSEIIAEYIHYKCCKFAKAETADSKIVTDEILAVFYVLFENNHTYVLMTLLRINFKGYEFNKKYASVLSPIFKKYLTKKVTYQSTDFSYSRLILCFKKWKSLVHEAEQKENINTIAMGDFSLEKYPTGLLPSKIPEREEKQLLTIFPLYNQAKKLENRYGRSAATRALLRDDKSDLNKMICSYFKVFKASLKNEEDDILWYLEGRSTPLESRHHHHQQQQRVSRIFSNGDNNISGEATDVIVLSDDDEEQFSEKELVVENSPCCSEGDNNNENNSVNPPEIEQTSYGAYSDISSAHEEDDLSGNDDCVYSSEINQSESWSKHPVDLLPFQPPNICTTQTIAQMPVTMSLNYHHFSIIPVVNEWTHRAGTFSLRCHNPENSEVFVNDNNIHSSEQNQQQNEPDLYTNSKNMFDKSILQNARVSECENLFNANINELNNSLRECIINKPILSSNIPTSSDNLSDQICDNAIHFPNKNLAPEANMSQENFTPTQCEKLNEIFMRRCCLETYKTDSESIVTGSIMSEDSLAQNSVQSIQSKNDQELDNTSKKNCLPTEIPNDAATIEPLKQQIAQKESTPQTEAGPVKEFVSEIKHVSKRERVRSEKSPTPLKEPPPAKGSVPEKKQILDDHPIGNERVEGLNIKSHLVGSTPLSKVERFKNKETAKNTENIAEEAFNLSTEITTMTATQVHPVIGEKQPVSQKEAGLAKGLIPEKKQVPKREQAQLEESPTPQKEPPLAKCLVPEKEQVLDDHSLGNERVEGLNIKSHFGGSTQVSKVEKFKNKGTAKNTENIAEEVNLPTEIATTTAAVQIHPVLGEKQFFSQKEARAAKELVPEKKQVPKRERAQSKESPTPQKEQPPAKGLVPEKEQVLDDHPIGNESVEGSNITSYLGRPKIDLISEEKQPVPQKEAEHSKELLSEKKQISKTERVWSIETNPQKEPPPAKVSAPENEQVLNDYPMGNERVEGLNITSYLGRPKIDLISEEKQPVPQKEAEHSKELLSQKKQVLKRERVRSKETNSPKEPPPTKLSVAEKEQVLNDHPTGNERVEGLNIKSHLGGSTDVSQVEKATKNPENIAEKVNLSIERMTTTATQIQPLLGEKQPFSRKETGPARELVPEKKQVPKREQVRSSKPITQTEPAPAKGSVPEKEKALDGHAMRNERMEGLNIKSHLGGMKINLILEEKEPVPQTKVEHSKELLSENKQISKRERVWSIETNPQKEPPIAKGSVPEKEQVLIGHSMGNERVEGLNIKSHLGGSTQVTKVEKLTKKEATKNTENIAEELILSTEIATTTVAQIHRVLGEKPQFSQKPAEHSKELLSEKKQVSKRERVRSKETNSQKEPPPTKISVAEKEQVLDDHPMGNERVEGLNIKSHLGGSTQVTKVEKLTKKEATKNTENIAEELILSTEIATTTVAQIHRVLGEKPQFSQKPAEHSKELLSEKKQVSKRERVRSKETNSQKEPPPTKISVAEKEQVLDDHPMGNERVEGLNIKSHLGGSTQVTKVEKLTKKEATKNTENIAEELILSTEIATTTVAQIHRVLGEKPQFSQKPAEHSKELLSEKKQVSKRERVRSKETNSQKEPPPTKISVAEKEQVLDDHPMGNERVEGLNIKSHLGGSTQVTKVEKLTKKEATKNTENIAEELILSTEIATTTVAQIHRVLGEKPQFSQKPAEHSKELLSEKKQVSKRERVRSKETNSQKEPPPTKISVAEKEQVLDDHPMGNERVEGLNIKSHLGGSTQVTKVEKLKKKEATKNTENIAEELILPTEIATTTAAQIHLVLGEKPQFSQKQAEHSKELLSEKKQVSKRERVRSKETNSQKEPPPTKISVAEKEQVLDDHPMGNERVEGLNIKSHLGGSTQVTKVEKLKKKEATKNTENIAEELILPTEIATTTAAQIHHVLGEKPQFSQKEAEHSKELLSEKKQVSKRERVRSKETNSQKEPPPTKISVAEKEQVLDDHPMGNERVEGLNIKSHLGGSTQVSKVEKLQKKEATKNTENIAGEVILPTEIATTTAAQIHHVLGEKPQFSQKETEHSKELLSEKKQVSKRERVRSKETNSQKEPPPTKISVAEKEQVLDDHPMGNERVEGLNIKSHLGGFTQVSKVEKLKKKEATKNTENIAEELILPTEIATTTAAQIHHVLGEKPQFSQKEAEHSKELLSEKKQVSKRERVRSKETNSQKEPPPTKISVAEKEQVLDDHPMGNERVEGLNIKSHLGGSTDVSKVEKATKNTENISDKVNLSTERTTATQIHPLLVEKQSFSRKEARPTKELAPEKKQVPKTEQVRSNKPITQIEPAPVKGSVPEKEKALDDHPMGNERVEGLNIKSRLGRTKINLILEEKQPVPQKEAEHSKELLSEKKQISKRERDRSNETNPQKELPTAKGSVPEKEQVLNDHPMRNERVEGLNIKANFGGPTHVSKVEKLKKKEATKNTENIAKEVNLSTEIATTTAAQIHHVLGEKQPFSQKEAERSKELLSEKKHVSKRERVQSKETNSKKEPPPKRSVLEKEQVFNDHPFGNERVEGLNIKSHLGGSTHVSKEEKFKNKETAKNTKYIAEEAFNSSTERTTMMASQIHSLLGEKQPLSRKEAEPAKELVLEKKQIPKREQVWLNKPITYTESALAKGSVPEKEKVLDDHPMGNERVKGLNIKSQLEGSKMNRILEEKKPVSQKEAEHSKELLSEKKQISKRERVQSIETNPQIEPPTAKGSVPEKEHDHLMGNERVEVLNIKSNFGNSTYVSKVEKLKNKEATKNTENIAKEINLSTEIATTTAMQIHHVLEEKQPFRQKEAEHSKELLSEKKQVSKTEQVQSKKPIKPITQTEPAPARGSVPEKEIALDDHPIGNERVEGLNIKSHLGGSTYVRKVDKFKNKEIAKNTKNIVEEVLNLSTKIATTKAQINPILEEKQPVSQKDAPAVNSVDAIKLLCIDKGSTKLKKNVLNICKVDAVNESRQSEIVTTQLILKRGNVGGFNKRRRKSPIVSRELKKQKIQAVSDTDCLNLSVFGNDNLDVVAPANTILNFEDAAAVLRVQPENNLQALQYMLVDTIEDTPQLQNSTDVVRVAEGMKNKSKQLSGRKSSPHKLNSEVDIIQVPQVQTGAYIARLVTKPLRKSITDEKPIEPSSVFVYGPQNDPIRKPEEAWRNSTSILTQRNNNIEANTLLCELEKPSSVITIQTDDNGKAQESTLQIQETHVFNPKNEHRNNHSENLHDNRKIIPKINNDQQTKDLGQFSRMECNITLKRIESIEEFQGSIEDATVNTIISENHCEIDNNSKRKTEKNKNLVQNSDFAADLIENKNSLKNKTQPKDGNCGMVPFVDKVSSLLTPSESVNKSGNNTLRTQQVSRTSKLENIEKQDFLAKQSINGADILKSLNLMKVEKPSQCLNKPEVLQVNITKKDCTLISSDKDQTSPTILEKKQNDISNVQFLDVESKLQKHKNKENIKILEIVKLNNVTIDTDNDSSSPAFSPLSTSSQISDDDTKKPPDYNKQNEIIEKKNDEILATSTCLLVDNEITKTTENSNKNLSVSPIVQLNEGTTITSSNSEISTVLKPDKVVIDEISIVPLLDEEQAFAQHSKTSEVPVRNQELGSVTSPVESGKFPNFSWTQQGDLLDNIFDNGNKTTSNVADMANEVVLNSAKLLSWHDGQNLIENEPELLPFSANDNAVNLPIEDIGRVDPSTIPKIVDFIDASYTTYFIPQDGERRGVKDVMCSQSGNNIHDSTTFQAALTLNPDVLNDTPPISADFCVSFGNLNSSVLITQAPFHGSAIPIDGEDFFLLRASTDETKNNIEEKNHINEGNNPDSVSTDNIGDQSTPVVPSTSETFTEHVLPKTIQPIKDSLKFVPDKGNKSNEKSSTETMPTNDSVNESNILKQSTSKSSPRAEKQIDSVEVIHKKHNNIDVGIAKTIDGTVKKSMTKSTNEINRHNSNFDVKFASKLTAAPLKFAWQRSRNASKIGNDKSKIEEKNVQEEVKGAQKIEGVQEVGKYIHSYSVPNKNLPRISLRKRPAPSNSESKLREECKTDLFEHVKNTPAPSQILYKGDSRNSFNVCSFEVKEPKTKTLEPFQFQHFSNEQVLAQLRSEKKRRLQS